MAHPTGWLDKHPHLPLVVSDWLEDEYLALAHPAVRGVYIDLLCWQWREGSIPSDTEELCRIARTTHDIFDKAWARLSHKFEAAGDGRLTNTKLARMRNAAGGKQRMSITGQAGIVGAMAYAWSQVYPALGAPTWTKTQCITLNNMQKLRGQEEMLRAWNAFLAKPTRNSEAHSLAIWMASYDTWRQAGAPLQFAAPGGDANAVCVDLDCRHRRHLHALTGACRVDMCLCNGFKP